MLDNIGGYKTINAFVKAKTDRLIKSGKTFADLFELSFSEGENFLFEESCGFKIKKYSYADAKKDIIGLAPQIRSAIAADAGTRVGLALPDSYEWIVYFWGLLAAGYNPVLVNTRLGAEILERTLAENGVGTVVTSAAENPFGGNTKLRILDIKDVASGNCGAENTPADGKFGTDVFVMSSGTSSHVKFCAYGAEEIIDQIIVSSDIIRQCRESKKHYNGELKHLCLLPFCHVFGLTAVFFWFSFFSRCFVKLNDLSPQTVQSTIKRHKVTHVFAVPLFWEKTYEAAMEGIRERGEKTVKRFEKGMKISRALDFCPPLRSLFTKIAFKELRTEIFGDSISFTISGGSNVSRDVIEFFNRIGYPLANGYGMSETGITSVELRRKVRFAEPLSVGKELSSVTYRIADDGILEVSGSSRAKFIVCEGKKTERGASFRTGDYAVYDKKHDTYLINGRSDELVIGRSGENLNPVLIESALENCGADRVCLCSVKDGSSTCSALIVSFNRYLSADARLALKNNIRSRLEKLGLLSQIEKTVFTEVPLLTEDDFKLNRRIIAERYEAGEYTEKEPDSTVLQSRGNEITEQIRAAFAKVLHKKPEEISDDADFFTDLGGSSFDWYGLIRMLSDKFGVNFGQAPAGTTSVGKMSAAAEVLLEKITH